MAQSLSNLPLGAKVKFGRHSVNGETPQEISWLIVAKNHQCTPAYPSNSVTLFAEKILDIRCYDEKETGGTEDRTKYGNNRYSLSNLDQWLNKDSAAGEWYVATHSYDVPPSNVTDLIKSPYTNRPGFLHYFTEVEKEAILDTTIQVDKPTADGIGDDNITRKVFLPSRKEVRLGEHEGATWEKYLTGYPTTQVTSQCVSNSPSKPSSAYGIYWLRSPNTATSHSTTWYDSSDPTSYSTVVAAREAGVRPALNLSATATVSDTTDTDGCYTLILNTAPPHPTTLNVPSTIYGGKTNNISWSKVADPDGDAIAYSLECAYDGGDFSQIYSGTAMSYNHSVTYGKTSIQYRIKAVDSKGATSSYVTSAVKTIVNNSAPVISGTDGNLGVKTNGFTQTYTITDADADNVTIVERIDGVQIRSYVATLGATNTFSVTGNTWLSQTNGSHIMTITAIDAFGNSVVRTYTFTKTITSFSVENTSAMSADTMPTRIALSVTRNVPAEATFKVEVCNNGFDSSPAWEDATSSVTNNNVYLFENTSKTASGWGVKIRVTVNRNGADGACYITSIGGNFE